MHELGSEAAQAFVASPGVDVVSYTGSTAVGKGSCVVCDDAGLAIAVPEILAAGTILLGHQCTAASRILVQRKVHGAFREAMAAAMKDLRLRPGHLPDSQMGATIDCTQRDDGMHDFREEKHVYQEIGSL